MPMLQPVAGRAVLYAEPRAEVRPFRPSPRATVAPPRPSPVTLEAGVPARGLSRDLATFEAMLAGRLAIDEGLERVAASGGWPIRTARGYIVAVRDPGADLQLVGDHNDWRPQAMRRQGGLCWSHVAMPAVEPLRYKIVDPQGEHRADPNARRFGYDEHGEHSLLDARGAHLERWTLEGVPGLAARTVRVWVPEGTPTHHLYVFDGQNLFDPQRPHGGWQLHEKVGPRTLVIGIDHGRDRFLELTPHPDVIKGQRVGGGAAALSDHLDKTLRPRIEARYGKPMKVGVMGASLGGVMALYQALRHRGRYDFAASLSGTVGWGHLGQEGPTLGDLYADAPRLPTTFYVDSGGGPDGGDNYADNVSFVEALRALGYSAQLRYQHAAGATHDEASWRERLGDPIEMFEG